MDRRGELEIAINKRTVERSVFLLIIVVLSVLLYLSHQATPDVQLLANVTTLSEQVAAKQTQIDQLQTQLQEQQEQQQLEVEAAKEREQAMQDAGTATPAETSAPAPAALSGKIAVDWNVKGGVMTATQYNAEAIATKQEQVNNLEDDKDAASGQEKVDIQNEIDKLNDEIDVLKTGDPKVKLEGVTVTIENGKDTNAAFDYTLCWTTVDCNRIKATGSIVVSSGEEETKDLPLSIPTLLALTSDQVLQLTVEQDGSTIFKDTKSFSS